jgi:heat shock protein HslJ
MSDDLTRRALALPLVALLLSTGCGPKPPADEEPPQDPPTPPPAAATAASIVDRDWILVAMGERPAPLGAGDRPVTLRLESASSRAVGFAGCNRYSGNYVLGGDSLKFGPAISTKMSCGEASDRVEQSFLAMLPLLVSYAATDSSLTLHGPGGPLAQFRKSPPPPERSEAAPAQDTGGGDRIVRLPRRGTVPMEITAEIGGRESRVTGTGECAHSADASIYQRPARVWTARYQGADTDPIQYSNLTVWQAKAGSTVEFNLSIRTGSGQHDIATVQGGDLKGSGTASLADVAGGRLSVEGKTASGTPLRLQVKCERFTELVAEGG